MMRSELDALQRFVAYTKVSRLLQLLHQLFWRQNLAAKRNQNSKERRETIKEECLSDNTDQSPHNADSRSYVRGGATRRCYPSEDRRRLSIHKGGYIEESTEDEEESDESSPTLVCDSPCPQF